jgi:hypothetical protein
MNTFSIDIGKFAKKVEGDADKVVRELCLNLLKDIVYATPVDTGRARANWFTSINRPSNETIAFEGGAASGQNLSISRAMSDISKATGNVFWISNNLPYIYRLEFEGWSKQAPRGMVRIAIDNMKRDLR